MRTIFAAVVLLGIIFLAGTTEATLINFDNIPGDMVPVTNQYASLGVNFSQAYTLSSWNDSYAPYPVYQGNIIAFGYVYNSSQLTFDQPINSFALQVTGSYYPISLQAYDINENLLREATSSFPMGYWHDYSIDLSGLSNVRIMRITGSANQFGFDNITFDKGNNIIPEPATLSILGLGLLGAAGLRRRK